MRCCKFVLLVLGMFLVGCGRSSQTPEPIAQGTPLENYLIGEPFRHGNLTVFPIASKTTLAEDRFITLDEGLKAGTVEIREIGTGSPNQQDEEPQEQPNVQNSPPQVEPSEPQRQAANPDGGAFGGGAFGGGGGGFGGGGSVNQLVVINSSGKPLYLMPGEIIIGGQQDRTIGEEIIIASTGKPVPVKVFCVEHARWNRRDVSDNVGYFQTLQVHDSNKLDEAELKQLAEEANKGKFVLSAGNASKGVRLAVQGAMDQGKVWDEVATLNAKSGAQSASGAFTDNYGNMEIAKKLEPYLDALQEKIDQHTNVIGVVVAVNGKVEAVDLFGSTPLFKKLWPKLLKSYALDALSQSDAEPAKAICETADAVDFLKAALSAKVAKKDTRHSLCVTRRESDEVTAFTLSVVPVADGQSGGGFGGGGAVHTSAFSK